jgi:hypothetical protein
MATDFPCFQKIKKHKNKKKKPLLTKKI